MWLERLHLQGSRKFKSCPSAHGVRIDDFFFWTKIASGVRLEGLWPQVGEDLEDQARASKCIRHSIESLEVCNQSDEISKKCFSRINIPNKHAIWDLEFFEGQVYVFKLNYVRFLISHQEIKSA